MPTLVDIEMLSPPVRKLVEKELPAIEQRIMDAKWHPDYLMTYKEAGELYGYTYQTMRHYVFQGLIKKLETEHGIRFTHAAMKAYTHSVNPSYGRPRIAETI